MQIGKALYFLLAPSMDTPSKKFFSLFVIVVEGINLTELREDWTFTFF